MGRHKKKQRVDQLKRSACNIDDELIDPHIGELEPPAEGSYRVIEMNPSGTGNREGEIYLLEEKDLLDKLAGDANADAVTASITTETDDQGIREDFRDR
jgi:hypothetical protein